MSDKRDAAPMEPERGSQQVKLLAGRILSILGLLLALGGIVSVLLSSTAASADISEGAVASLLGVVGYFLGSRRLGLATVVVAVLAVVFGLAATQGVIPGSGPTDRELPQREIQAE